MDPITTAIIATLTGGMNSIGQQVIADSYAAIKALIKKKFGDQSEVTKAVESLEAKPQSSSRQATLQEEIEDAKVNQDSDILKLAQELLKQISAQPSGAQHIVTIQKIGVKGSLSAIAAALAAVPSVRTKEHAQFASSTWAF